MPFTSSSARIRLVVALVVAALVLPSGSGWAATAAHAQADAPVAVQPADVDDFSFESFDAEYILSQAADGSSQMSVQETLVALFPEYDQNRGIVRAIPETYNGVNVHVDLQQVTDASGAAVEFSASHESGYLQVSIGTDAYVHGRQTYVISYTLGNVIREVADENIQELYWNVNGLDWPQAFGTVSATLILEGSLMSARSDQVACYRGGYGDAATCSEIVDDNSTVTFRADGVQAEQTLTVALGFDSGTFVVPTSPLRQLGVWLGVVLLVLVAVAGMGVLALVRRRRWQHRTGRGTVIPEYAPPAGVDLFGCAAVHGDAGMRATVAELVALAVRGVLTITSSGRNGKRFSVTCRVEPSAPAPDAVLPTDESQWAQGWPATRAGEAAPLTVAEVALLEAVFGHPPRPGDAVDLSHTNQRRGDAVHALLSQQKARAEKMGLLHKPQRALPWWPSLLSGAAAIGVCAWGIIITIQTLNPVVGVLGGLIFLGVLVLTGLMRIRPRRRTYPGALLSEYLEGTRMYIGWAEQDRLAFLQSVDTAERVGPEQRVHLYERMLPVAILVGLESSWAPVMSEAFAAASLEPTWYQGSAGRGFDAVVFASQLRTLTESASHGLSAPPSSSGASGSAGGGFAGGGGGGGGGGGR